jgi:uncharacterized membrane protein YphA (DoxX/SURF4 family)
MRRHVITEIISFLFLFLFIYAAVNKLLDFQKFQTQLLQSPVVASVANLVAIAIPGSEIIISLMLAIPKFRLAGLYGSFFLMIAFTTYIIVVLNFSFYVPCSCGGIFDKLGWSEHLIFNFVFCLFAIVGIISESGKLKPSTSSRMKGMLILVGATALGGMASVLMLNWVSNDSIQSGDFYRFYPAHSVVFSSHLDLTEHSNKITGVTNSRIFLSSTENPDQLLVIDHQLTESESVRIDVSQFEPLRFYSLSIKIDSPYFYLSDGSIPFLFRGSIATWKVTDSLPSPANFNELLPISKTSFAIRSLNFRKHENEIGKLTLSDLKTTYNADLLEKQVDGIFCTDGMLHYSSSLHQLIYLYYYRNQYLLVDSSLQLHFRGRTIDTVSRVQVKTAALKYSGHQSNQLINPGATVNKRSCVYQHWFFVISQVKATNENFVLYDASTGIDVYDLIEHRYLFSFYLPDFQGMKVKDIVAAEGQLFVLFGNRIERYTLNPSHFKPGGQPSGKDILSRLDQE